ncbi:MAG: DUF429 domain-containing protein [Bacteroidetes bacterium]|jgi:predicted RNase H-like nuclease|nr:DUF429 domain-containing protein [Bacteroidota bacterium]
MSNFIGLDACRMGWCGIGQIEGKLIWGCFKSLENLIETYPALKLILIDIPIGLSSKHASRTVDAKARTHLKRRKSSIFSPPCREALYAKNYQEALKINRKITGKGISIQAYNISPKIKAVDEWLSEKPNDLDIYEAHPELCFKTLNKNIDLKYSKHDKTGLKERQNLLFDLDSNLKSVYKDFMTTYKREHIKPDDIFDAMSLYLIAKKQHSLQYIADDNTEDEREIPIRIVYG